MAAGVGECRRCRRVVGLHSKRLCSPCWRLVGHLYPAGRRGPKPKVPRDLMLASGLSAAVLARAYGASERSVYRAAKRLNHTEGGQC